MEPVTQHVSRTAEAEYRWPAVGALVVALALYAFLPNELVGVQRFVVVSAGLLLLIPLSVVQSAPPPPARRCWSRMLSVALSLRARAGQPGHARDPRVQARQRPPRRSGPSPGRRAGVGAHVIVFALIFWEMDRGGPVIRTTGERTGSSAADFRFPQDEDHDAIVEVAEGSSARVRLDGGVHRLPVLSLANTMAFSPPTRCRSRSARSPGRAAGVRGFVILVLVIARAVGSSTDPADARRHRRWR